MATAISSPDEVVLVASTKQSVINGWSGAAGMDAFVHIEYYVSGLLKGYA